MVSKRYFLSEALILDGLLVGCVMVFLILRWMATRYDITLSVFGCLLGFCGILFFLYTASQSRAEEVRKLIPGLGADVHERICRFYRTGLAAFGMLIPTLLLAMTERTISLLVAFQLTAIFLLTSMAYRLDTRVQAIQKQKK